MAFSDEIAKVSSSRFVLARLEPGRNINDNLSSIGGSLHTATFSNTVVSGVARNGVVFTRVTGTPIAGEFSFDESTGLLTVFSIASPSDTVIFIMTFYLFYGSDFDRIFPEGVTTGTDRCWQGRISKNPVFGQSIDNMIKAGGKITSTQTSLSIHNADLEFNKIITEPKNFSFKNKKIATWISVNGEIRKMLDGNITSITIGEKEVSFAFNDDLNIAFDKPAFNGDGVDDAVTNTTSFPDLSVKDLNKPIPMIMSDSSPHSYLIDENDSAQANYNSLNFLDPKKCLRAYNIDATGGTTTDNREFVLCRLKSDASLKTLSLTLSSTTAVGDAFRFGFNLVDDSVGAGFSVHSNIVEFSFTSHNLEVGDTFKYEATPPSTAGPGTYYAVVMHIESGSPDVVTCFTDYFIDIGLDKDIFGVTIVSIADSPAVFLEKGGKVYIPFAEKDYTTSVTSLASGNKIVKITFVNNFETRSAISVDNEISQSCFGINIDDIQSIKNTQRVAAGNASITLDRLENVGEMNVYYVARTSGSDHNWAANLKRLIDDAGYSTSAASFTAAASALATDTHFTIPFSGENNFSPYNKYIEAILRSVFGVIFFDNAQDINVKLFSAAGTSKTGADCNNILTGQLSMKIDYNDLVTELQLSNEHVSPETLLNDDTNEIISNLASKFLNDTEKRESMKHVLVDLSAVSDTNERLDKMIQFKNASIVTYKLRTATDHLDTEVDDLVTITSDFVLGGSGALTDGKVIKTVKSEQDTELTIIDTSSIV